MVRVVRCWVLLCRLWFWGDWWKLIVGFNNIDVQLLDPSISVLGNDLPALEDVVVYL